MKKATLCSECTCLTVYGKDAELIADLAFLVLVLTFVATLGKVLK